MSGDEDMSHVFYMEGRFPGQRHNSENHEFQIVSVDVIGQGRLPAFAVGHNLRRPKHVGEFWRQHFVLVYTPTRRPIVGFVDSAWHVARWQKPTPSRHGPPNAKWAGSPGEV